MHPRARRAEIEAALRRLAPRIPAHEFGAILDHALTSRGLHSAAPETAAWLSMVAYVRHTLTDYDDLLAEGYGSEEARFFVMQEGRLFFEGSEAELRASDDPYVQKFARPGSS